MTGPTGSAPAKNWESLLLSERPARAVWTDVFARLGELALAASSPGALHRETITPDRLLAESAWDLWQAFPTEAPKVVDGLREFWTGPTASAGTAVLIYRRSRSGFCRSTRTYPVDARAR